MYESEQEEWTRRKTDEMFRKEFREQACHVDRLFMFLMFVQWIGAIIAAIFISPRTWIGETSAIHVHVLAAIFLGGLIASAPALMAYFYPGRIVTRHVIAVAQALWSALLIHLLGGRIETHFHIFGSLAFIALYRDWKVLISMSLVVAVDHGVRGYIWPLSVYGTTLDSTYRFLEHVGWVLFEDIVLISACFRGYEQMRDGCAKQAALEWLNLKFEQKVRERSADLEDTKQFYQAVLDSMQEHVCVLDERGNVVGTNVKWDEYAVENGGTILESQANYIETCRRAQGSCAEDATKLARAIEAVIAGFEPHYSAEYDCSYGDHESWYRVNVTPLMNHSRGAAVVAHSNITERVRVQRRLEKATQELELMSLVAKYTDNAVIVTDRVGRIEWVNEGFERLTGYDKESVIGKSPATFLIGEHTDKETVAKMHEHLERQEGCNVELLNYRKDGTPFWVAAEIRPILSEEHNATRYIAIESDITLRKNAEQERETLHEELRSAARRAGMAEVATGVLHNVGNVLNSLNISTQTLARSLETSPVPKLARASEIVSQHRDNLAEFLCEDPRGKILPEMLDQFSQKLTFDRESEMEEIRSIQNCLEHIQQIISKQQQIARNPREILEKVDVLELVEEAIKLCDQEQGIRPKIRRCSSAAENVVTDKHKVLQILINLLNNAMEATHARDSEGSLTSREPLVEVLIHSDERQLVLSVRDNGIGINSTYITQIFGHGFTTKETGHGFGLHSCALDAQSLGGSLSATSDGVGSGAMITLTLPLRSHSSLTSV